MTASSQIIMNGACFIIHGLMYGIRYVRGLQVMLIDVDNVNQDKSNKWVCHIFFISNFSIEID